MYDWDKEEWIVYCTVVFFVAVLLGTLIWGMTLEYDVKYRKVKVLEQLPALIESGKVSVVVDTDGDVEEMEEASDDKLH